MTRFKGPHFKSFDNQNTEPKKILVWQPGTQSTRQKIRNLMRKCDAVLGSRDPAVHAAAQRVVQSTLDEPNPVYAYLHLFSVAIDVADETGHPWHDCMNAIMDEFDRKEGAGSVELEYHPLTNKQVKR